ncbi:MAG: efflux RND transporter periplasmic adaptor subunit [Bacteroidota bacterium]
MKKLSYLLIAGILLSACGAGEQKSMEGLIADGNLDALKSKRQEISEQHKQLGTEIKLLDSVIDALDTNKNFPLVTTFEAKTQEFHHYLDLQGNVSTKQNVLIFPEMAGALVRVYVKEGQRVSKGQLLAKIDDGGVGSVLEQLKTEAALAKTTYERQKRLWDQKIGSEIQFLQAKANYEAIDNSVKSTQSQLSKSTIRAPFSGIIDNVIQDQGTVVSPGTGEAVFRIVNLGDMFIEVDVPESYLGGVSKGKPVQVYFPVLDDSVSTKVRETGNFIDPTNRSFRVEIPVPNKNGMVKPNLTARVKINDYTNEEAILVPQSVISENAEGEQYVYTAIDQKEGSLAKASKRIISTGKTQGDYVEILKGINSGEHIIMEGARSVREDQEIRIIE